MPFILLSAAIADAQTPPVDPQTLCNPIFNMANVARFLMNDAVSLEAKQWMMEQFRPRAIQDRQGNVWVYECGQQPYIVRYAPGPAPAAPTMSTQTTQAPSLGATHCTYRPTQFGHDYNAMLSDCH
jgi:hypothetical protein